MNYLTFGPEKRINDYNNLYGNISMFSHFNIIDLFKFLHDEVNIIEICYIIEHDHLWYLYRHHDKTMWYVKYDKRKSYEDSDCFTFIQKTLRQLNNEYIYLMKHDKKRKKIFWYKDVTFIEDDPDLIRYIVGEEYVLQIADEYPEFFKNEKRIKFSIEI